MFLSDSDIEAILLTLRLASITTLILFLVGTPIAWWLSRTRSRWKGPVGALVAMPLVLPPTVLGFYLLVTMGPNGPVGWLTQTLGLGLLPFGRLTAEAMAARLCRDLGLTPGNNAFGNIERLEKSGSIATWINSYLHSLRILGNESVHLTERDQRTPRTLAAGDLIVILSNLARVLDFYRVWQAQRTRGETKEAE
jgi:hypothetical protein